MQRSEVKVLIVEDDPSVGKVLLEGIKRSGLDAKWAQDPDEALATFRITEFHLVIADCMLPKTNGVELIKRMRESGSDNFRSILTSGIFKDKKFSQDAVAQTQSSAFLSKPFDIEKLLAVIEDSLSDFLTPNKDPLYDLMMRPNVPLADVQSALESSGAIHGFELPLVYSLLVNAGYSGQLNLIPADGNLASVQFHQGRIFDVSMKDSTSYFGVLLVEMGFASFEDVQKILASQEKKPIGMRLVDAEALSPHAIEIVKTEQMLIRLSKTIQETSVEVQLLPPLDLPQNQPLTPTQFSTGLQDWVITKLTDSWLKTAYLQWTDHPLRVTENLDRLTRLRDFDLFQDVEPWLARFDGKTTLNALLEGSEVSETNLLRIIHFGLLERVFYFGSTVKASSNSVQSKLNRLKALAQNMESKDHFEVLGLSRQARSKEISRVYLELAKAFHPDRMGPDATPELKKLSESVFARVSVAYEILKDETKRKDYQRQLEQGSAEEILSIESVFDSGYKAITQGKYSQAVKLFREVVQSKHMQGQGRIHLAWALLRVGAKNKTIESHLTEVSEVLSQVPPEDRHCAPYFFVKGLLYKATGRNDKAAVFMNNALSLEPSLAEVKTEFMRTKSDLKRHPGNSEWPSVMTKMFKKAK